jgi:hypothetical protein
MSRASNATRAYLEDSFFLWGFCRDCPASIIKQESPDDPGDMECECEMDPADPRCERKERYQEIRDHLMAIDELWGGN